MFCLSGKANGKRLPLKTLKTKIHQIRELNWLEQNETLDKLLQRKLNYEDAWHKRQLGPPAGDLGSKNLVPLVPLVPLVHLGPLVALTGAWLGRSKDIVIRQITDTSYTLTQARKITPWQVRGGFPLVNIGIDSTEWSLNAPRKADADKPDIVPVLSYWMGAAGWS